MSQIIYIKQKRETFLKQENIFYITCKKFWTFYFGHLIFGHFFPHFRQKFRTLRWNMPKVDLWLKPINQTEIKSVKMKVLLYLQRFTVGCTIKETNIFLSSDNKNDWATPPNPNSSHIMYIGFEYMKPSPRKYF